MFYVKSDDIHVYVHVRICDSTFYIVCCQDEIHYTRWSGRECTQYMDKKKARVAKVTI